MRGRRAGDRPSHQLEEWEAEQTRALNAHLRAHTSSGRVRLGLAGKADRTRTVYVGTTLLDLITPLGPAAPGDSAEQPGDSFDEIVVPLAAQPDEAGDHVRCGYWLPRAGRTCNLPPGHRGQQR